MSPRGGRPRLFCQECRPSASRIRRAADDSEELVAPCRTCGAPVDRSTVPRFGRRRVRCHACAPPQIATPEVRLADLLAESGLCATRRAVLERVAERAAAAEWSERALGRWLVKLHRLLDDHVEGAKVPLSRVQEQFGHPGHAGLVREVLAEFDVLAVDTVPAIRAWIDRRTATLPSGYQPLVRDWLLELLDGGDRTKPRSEGTVRAYFSRVQPPLLTWSQTRAQLREVTVGDVTAVLEPLRGHDLAGTYTSLRSLFRFAKRHRLIFADPTRRLHIGRAPRRTLLPMTEQELAAVKKAAVTPAQRLVVALVAVYAVRAASVRRLTLDDLHLAGRRIRIGGQDHRLPEFVHQALLDWLRERHRAWPHTANRHVLVSAFTAAGTQPVTHYFLVWHLLMQDVSLEHIRGDRVLHEALTVGPDPLHLATAFNLSTSTALDYADIARSVLERPIDSA